MADDLGEEWKRLTEAFPQSFECRVASTPPSPNRRFSWREMFERARTPQRRKQLLKHQRRMRRWADRLVKG